ncbi:N-acyl-D-amino-acid deacylase family protein [Pseudomonas sp. N040]|uniref:N-acyl-D-amino-acid deacylase family protein n=1 Tax=Pseudomonas sp. N040 TaxID=2785325 RepID=UPI0018A26E56|nr:amidohydrolase family protein [Pseudomonas sp. N040]MBF7731231.1 amidohydrolase family protein [Pseudomonas sp. N040]MBW7014874.1 amidohydrolase family protein [Pseudomonas sp. N040]
MFDVLIKNGLFFDGTGAPGALRHVGIRDGKVAAISAEPLDEAGCGRVLDARERWVTPGFIDMHTHYDAELVAAPALKESVRHGVTTVMIGSCSISMVLSAAEDCADLFTRVESVPREHVLPLLEAHKHWSSAREYAAFLDRHPLGPNICSFLGHSDLRVAVMGLERAVDPRYKPSEGELQRMESLLEEALDEGLLGLSSMTNPWDKLDGERERSKSLPSVYAPWREYARLNRILRRRQRIHQGAPNLVTKLNVLAFLWDSMGLWLRKPLKTTLITLMDAKADPWLAKVLGPLTRLVNRLTQADFRWQTLPVPFETYADGMEFVVFEEFPAGQAALHLASHDLRSELFRDPDYRRRFRQDVDKRFGPRVWHRDFDDAWIVACPDASVVGKSVGELARQRAMHPGDLFLDLLVAHGPHLRWRTVLANHRPEVVARLVAEPSTLIGFADSGAHIRNMAFYNFALRFLKLVRDAELQGRPVMPVEKAVWRLTGELGGWFGVDAGVLAVGKRADLVILDPQRLDASLSQYQEAPMEAFGGLQRMVNRGSAVDAVLINGRLAFDHGRFAEELGQSRGFGQFLRAG